MPRYIVDPADLKFVVMATEERCAADSAHFEECMQGARFALEEMSGIIKPHKPPGRVISLSGRKKKRR